LFSLKNLGKSTKLSQKFLRNHNFCGTRAAPLRLEPNEALCCSSSAKVVIQKLPSSLPTVAHQAYKLTTWISMFFGAFHQITTFAKTFREKFSQKPFTKN
jgi:hypothetical protein